MKYSFLLKSGFCVCVAVSALAPLSTLADEQGKMGPGWSSYGIGETPTVYGNAGEESVRSERGAMGPKAGDRMEGVAETRYLSGENPTQYVWWESGKTGHGAQGPIRNEGLNDRGAGYFQGEMPSQYGR
ncbi:hypothetical protein LZ012_12420 [Dechloromonas sp. XY25]|uniref:Uncharacterized protein n=1 Tax=Dechloromonas hankyongensis TaxID=2908002 RepID=A0ABS9K3P0_9RHOO|nr:hypothetical protein [Dechloromonas hankyongensis]MCG2577798.1 hypothetical protein [Dechloromonas hankyongensis]